MGANPNADLSIARLRRSRWNVIDLITVFGKDVVPGHIFCDIDCSRAETLMAKSLEQGDRVTITALLIKSIALAQQQHPASRSYILPWGKLFEIKHIMAGFTVEKMVDGKPTVFFGIVDNPVEKSIEQIALELNEYSNCQISSLPQLALEDRFTRMPWLVRQFMLLLARYIPALRLTYLGATFGLSSLGKYGIHAATGPCASIATFGVGTIEPRPIAVDGQIVIKSMLTLALSFDYRVMDHRSALRFLLAVRQLVEGSMQSDLRI